jgi:hypothetical protein
VLCKRPAGAVEPNLNRFIGHIEQFGEFAAPPEDLLSE